MSRFCETHKALRGHCSCKPPQTSGSEVAFSDGLDAPAVDEEMLVRAMKKAVEVGILPKHPVDTETYLKHWAGMKEVLQTAVGN